jgi:hypothetical protein
MGGGVDGLSSEFLKYDSQLGLPKGALFLAHKDWVLWEMYNDPWLLIFKYFKDASVFRRKKGVYFLPLLLN